MGISGKAKTIVFNDGATGQTVTIIENLCSFPKRYIWLI